VTPPDRKPPAAGRRVLIVDDEIVNVMLLEELLDGECDALAVAGTGEAALDLIASFRPDLVLLDVMLPGIDGHEVCRRLRADPDLEGLKVVMVSARAMPEDRAAGLAAGADDYRTKPLDFDAFLDGVRAHLAGIG